MLGWASEATARASRSKRAVSASGARSFSATRRPSSVSVAAQTSDMPPRPSSSSRRYRPAMVSSVMPIRYVLNVASLLTMREAQERVLAHVRQLSAESVPVANAAGRVTAEAASAAGDLPPFASSAVDGYAVRAADLPGRLPVVAEIAAGRPAERALEPGEAMAISTGGVVPAGADAVLPLEYVVTHDNVIETGEKLEAGAHVRPRGGDAAVGDIVVP